MGLFITRRIVAAMGIGLAVTSALRPVTAQAADHFPRFTDKFADSAGVRIHYVTAGRPGAPMVLMVHGMADFWYGWRHLMAELAEDYHVVAMDQRGYNLSDKPEGVANYERQFLINDIAAVIRAEGRRSTILIGHDWGASTSWRVATDRPDLVDRLVIMSVPHPTNFARALRDDPVQQQASQYALDFRAPGAESAWTPEVAAYWVTDAAAKPKYIEALGRSNFTSLFNYYRANYPSQFGPSMVVPEFPKVKAPVLLFHGAKDRIPTTGHDGTWKLVEKDLTMVILPEAGHMIHQDAAAVVNPTIHDWLRARPITAAQQMR